MTPKWYRARAISLWPTASVHCFGRYAVVTSKDGVAVSAFLCETRERAVAASLGFTGAKIVDLEIGEHPLPKVATERRRSLSDRERD
jgi:hypothetical protein